MSSGQRPRWPEFYPHMKVRGRGRRRGVRIVVRDDAFRPMWPPVVHVGSLAVRIDRVRLTATSSNGTRHLDRWSGMWIEED